MSTPTRELTARELLLKESQRKHVEVDQNKRNWQTLIEQQKRAPQQVPDWRISHARKQLDRAVVERNYADALLHALPKGAA